MNTVNICWPARGFCTVFLIAGLLLAGCSTGGDNSNEGESYQVGEPVEDPEIAAVVTSESGADTLDAETFQMQTSQSGQPPNQVIEAFVARHVLDAEADRLDLEIEGEELEQHMDALKGRFENEEDYEAALEQQGMTEESLRETMIQTLRMQQMEQRFAEEAGEPEADEVENFINDRTSEVSAQHILLRVPEDASEEERSEIRAQGEAVLDSVQAGADFEELAQRHSEDGTAERGGDLGFIHRGQTVPAFDEAVFALADSGDVTSDLVETEFGYHIIRKTGERQLDAMDEEQARMSLMQERQQEAVEEGVDRLMANATVQVNPEVTGVNLDE